MIPKWMLPTTLGLTAALAFLPFVAGAQSEMKIYRCVDPSGAVTLQNDTPCPKGSQQTIRNVGALPTVPPPAAATRRERADPAKPPGHDTAKPQTPPAAQPPEAPPPPPLVRTPPPTLFQCRTWDEREYFGDTATPPGICVPVESVGIDGSRELGAGSTCEMRYDACIEVPQALLCQSWKTRMDEAEFRWKFGGGRNDERKAEFERVAKLYRESTCSGG